MSHVLWNGLLIMAFRQHFLCQGFKQPQRRDMTKAEILNVNLENSLKKYQPFTLPSIFLYRYILEMVIYTRF